MSVLPSGLEQALNAVAGELGMACASWVFVRAVARCAGDEGVSELVEKVGAEFVVLDAVARGWLAGNRAPNTDPSKVIDAIGKVTRVVVVGLEVEYLDRLLEKLRAAVKVAIVAHSAFPVDWQRVLDNYAGRVERVDLDTFQHWAGGKSALLTFAYGRADNARTAVVPLWLRACGPDVRAQFRVLIAWNVLASPLDLYPRRLALVDAGETFTHFV
jgi:hypothetical protein